MDSNLKEGNDFYRQKDYVSAIIKYSRALLDNPGLSRTLAFNIFVSKNRLGTIHSPNKFYELYKELSPANLKKLGLCPSIIFDFQYYLENNPDVQQSGLDPQVHYYEYGEAEGRWPNQYFDPDYYRNMYSDLETYSGSLFDHYIRHGFKEKRRIQPTPSQKNNFKNGKTLLLVSHDMEVGGAQQVIKLFAQWLIASTPYHVQIVSIESGNLRYSFEEIASCFVLSDYEPKDVNKALENWLNDTIVVCFINSIASVSILNHIDTQIPAISFIHEMPRILGEYQKNVQLLKNNGVRVLAGGPEVSRAFLDKYSFHSDQVYTCVSFIEPLSASDSGSMRAESRSSLGISDERFLIFGCGVLHWRKSPETFIKVAEIVLSQNNNVDFVWIGGGPDHEKCEKLVRAKGLDKRIRFTGYEPNVSAKLSGGDLFLLTSEEDPFPLVALYAAQAGMPIVCFEDAGGIEGFVKLGCGIATPFMNVHLMADAVINYINDPAKCLLHGEQGKNQVSQKHTVSSVAPILMHHIRDVGKLPPTVSVVVPNYNYESYLRERLESIKNQSFQDFEVILLDDCSSDRSVDILKDFSTHRLGTQVVINSENSGSPFVQWIRGMRKAHSDLIWLAEADDRCTPDLLEQMIPIFKDRNIFIASCGSRPITSDGQIIGDYRELYLNRISQGRWDESYVSTDHEEINSGLGIANSIPNASAVIFRKFSLDSQFEGDVTSMRLCGDWYFYLRAMQGGLYAFNCKVMNDHRRHGNTVTHNLEGSLRYFDELATVRSYINRTFRQSSNALMKVRSFLQQDIDRFKISNTHELPSPTESCKLLPTLLVVAPDLSPGGGQVFAISLANEWVHRGGRCLLLNVGNQQSHKAVIEQISNRVIYFDLNECSYNLKYFIKIFDIDVIHSCIWWADCWIYDNRADLPQEMPWIITMHGCHETILHHPQIDPSFLERMNWMSKRASWVYTAKKNLEVFDTIERPTQLVKICNGTKDQTFTTDISRSEVGLRSDSVVFCLASRAIEAKGWFESVRLVDRLVDKGHNVELLLIGEGPAANSLRKESRENLILVGQVSNLHDYLKLCDVGILPSYFEGESFPLILLEMMCNSLPIIASDIGEISSIIGGTSESAAGLVVPRKNKGIDEEEFFKASLIMLNKQARMNYANKARSRFLENFSIQKMVDDYAVLYDN